MYLKAKTPVEAGDIKLQIFDGKETYNYQFKYDSDLKMGVIELPKKIPNAVLVKISNGLSYKSTILQDIYGFSDVKIKQYEEIKNLSVVEGVNDVNFAWNNPTMVGFTGVKIYKEGSLVATVDKNKSSYKVDGLEANKNYNFKFVSVYADGESVGVQKGIKTLIDPKTIPPSPVSSLVAEPTDKTVKLKWKSPKDDDLAGFKILQNGKQIAEIGLEEEFIVKNLQPLTDYTFGVISVDRDKNDSPPVSLSVKTLEENDEEPPHVPSNVFAKPSNGALIASWDKVSDKDLAGYNVYVDGKKINSNLITSTNFVIKNLENSKKYKVQVQAVDRSGNASELSLAAFGTPDVNTIPVIESNYGVGDVSDGVGTMFGQIWPLLAFVVSIPLAFYVIYKLKHIILP
ncbi:fibronectin type III domain-containing protein [Bacillus pretiosus]|uniref:fibronectin type III domain-containing protein n=1 Tax=Bacillus pretiosus TaxID=2983392 RepID=UPI003D658785